MKKIWIKTTMVVEDQNIEIFPTETFDGIIIEPKESDDTPAYNLCITKGSMKLFIEQMQSMMDYVSEE
jgi:hypothetical protein